MKLKVISFSLILLFLLFTPVYAFQGSIWFESPEGWHFYKEKQVQKSKEEDKAETHYSDKSDKEELFTDKMQRRTKELLSKALEKQDIESVRQYIEHQKKMIEISEDFANLWQTVIAMYPDLVGYHPVSPVFRESEWKVRGEEQNKKLKEAAKRIGLFFVYSTTCPYCIQQAKVIKQFINEHPYFDLMAITIDGSILPDFPETQIDNGFASVLGVEQVPAIIAYFPPKGVIKLSEGLIDKATLERRLILYNELYETQNIEKYLTHIDSRLY